MSDFITPIIIKDIISDSIFIAECLRCHKAYLSINRICGCSKSCNKKIREIRRRKRESRNRIENGVNLKNAIYRFGRICKSCGEVTAHSMEINNSKRATIEHIIPLSKGGAHSWDNVEILCSECNSKRNSIIISKGK